MCDMIRSQTQTKRAQRAPELAASFLIPMCHIYATKNQMLTRESEMKLSHYKCGQENKVNLKKTKEEEKSPCTCKSRIATETMAVG